MPFFEARLVQVGALDAEEAKVPFSLIIHNYLRIIGTVMKSRSFEEKLAMTTRFRDRWLDAFSSGQLAPVLARTFPLDRADAVQHSMEGSGNFGKIVLTID